MSLYEFVDTLDNAGSESLPAEAMCWNGEYLEDVIPGYRTLYVRGRESIDTEIETIDVPAVNGARYLRKRDQARTLHVGYQLIAASDTAFRDAFNRLNALLDAEEAEIVFADEQDKYFVGTKVNTGQPQKGTNAITAEIEILCSDPYKYTTEDITVVPVSGDATFNYDGTHPAFPIFEITARSNLGFIGIADDAGHVIQVGDPLEVDQEDTWSREESITDVATNAPTGSPWTLNGLVPVNATIDNVRGSFSEGTASGKTASKPNYGTDNTRWHGPTLSFDVPDLPNDEGPVVNATLSWQMLFYDGTSKKTALGMFSAQMNDSSGKVLAAVRIYHSKSGNANSTLELWINGAKKKTVSFKATQANVWTGTKGGTCSIDKFGDTITYKIGTKTYTLRDSSIEDTAVARCGFWFARYKDKTVMTQNCLFKASIISHRVMSYQNVPNKIQEGDVIQVDVGSGTIFLNGVPAEGLGALGNDYETFKLTPGVNTVGFVCSDWAATEPEYKIIYKEAYI